MTASGAWLWVIKSARDYHRGMALYFLTAQPQPPPPSNQLTCKSVDNRARGCLKQPCRGAREATPERSNLPGWRTLQRQCLRRRLCPVQGKHHVTKLTGRARQGPAGGLETAKLSPSLTSMAGVFFSSFRRVRASLMASTCFRGWVTVMGERVGADKLQTTKLRKSKFCSHILFRTLAFLSEYWAHCKRALIYTVRGND